MEIHFSYLVLLGFFLALNWNLLISQQLDSDVDGTPGAKDPKDASHRKKWKYGNYSDKFAARWANVSTNSKEWRAQMAKSGGKMNQFNLCMGADFIKKCKLQIAVCAMLPIPQVCLFTMTCGGSNIKKCYNLVYGNMTITTTENPDDHKEATTLADTGDNAALAEA